MAARRRLKSLVELEVRWFGLDCWFANSPTVSVRGRPIRLPEVPGYTGQGRTQVPRRRDWVAGRMRDNRNRSGFENMECQSPSTASHIQIVEANSTLAGYSDARHECLGGKRRAGFDGLG